MASDVAASSSATADLLAGSSLSASVVGGSSATADLQYGDRVVVGHRGIVCGLGDPHGDRVRGRCRGELRRLQRAYRREVAFSVSIAGTSSASGDIETAITFRRARHRHRHCIVAPDDDRVLGEHRRIVVGVGQCAGSLRATTAWRDEILDRDDWFVLLDAEDTEVEDHGGEWEDRILGGTLMAATKSMRKHRPNRSASVRAGTHRLVSPSRDSSSGWSAAAGVTLTQTTSHDESRVLSRGGTLGPRIRSSTRSRRLTVSSSNGRSISWWWRNDRTPTWTTRTRRISGVGISRFTCGAAATLSLERTLGRGCVAWFYHQGREGACAGFSWGHVDHQSSSLRCVLALSARTRRRRVEQHAAEGASVRAVMDILRTKGHRRRACGLQLSGESPRASRRIGGRARSIRCARRSMPTCRSSADSRGSTSSITATDRGPRRERSTSHRVVDRSRQSRDAAWRSLRGDSRGLGSSRRIRHHKRLNGGYTTAHMNKYEVE